MTSTRTTCTGGGELQAQLTLNKITKPAKPKLSRMRRRDFPGKQTRKDERSIFQISILTRLFKVLYRAKNLVVSINLLFDKTLRKLHETIDVLKGAYQPH